MVVRAPDAPGTYVLQLTLVQEGVKWFEKSGQFHPLNLRFEVCPRLGYMMCDHERARMTLSCTDTACIPKVADAGEVRQQDGMRIQVMHEGSLVIAGGYHGSWMEDIIRGLRGHHEPQEELLFHELLKLVRPGTWIIEVGAFWAYYTNWYLGAVQGSRAVCVEPDEPSMRVGQTNLRLNGRKAKWVNAFVGREHSEAVAFRRESDGREVAVPCLDMEGLLALTGGEPVEVLHVDVQGSEWPLIQSMRRAVEAGLLRFVVVSTHHEMISGSKTTHQDCLKELRTLGASILSEFNVEESYAGDGLIVASFLPEDSNIRLPAVSRNSAHACLFGQTPKWSDYLEVAKTPRGPLLVLSSDDAIAQMHLSRASFGADKVSEATDFLVRKHGFLPESFIDIGASIGARLVHAVDSCGFSRGMGFEANPENFLLLQCNILLRELADRVQVFNVALSDKAGVSTMDLLPSKFEDHCMTIDVSERIAAASKGGTWSSRRVETATLDEFLKQQNITVSKNTLIWMHAQGQEGLILQGAHCLFSLDACPSVVVDIWPYGLERAGGRSALFALLAKAVAIYDIDGLDWTSGKVTSLAEVSHRYELAVRQSETCSGAHTNVLCVF
jgi:FkbM family methyltransferase